MSQVPFNPTVVGPNDSGSGFTLPGVTPGSVIVVDLRWNDSTLGTTTVVSSTDGPLIQIGTDIAQVGQTLLQRFYVKHSVGGTCTITPTSPDGYGAYHANAFEIPGCDPTAPLDVSAQAGPTSSASAASGVTATRAQANSVGIVSVGGNGLAPATAGTGFTLLAGAGDGALEVGYQVFAATGTDQGTMNVGASALWGCAMDVFKAASVASAWGPQLSDQLNRIVQGI